MKSSNRSKEGKKAIIVAIVGNIFLTVLNISIGMVSGSYALISEGAHTLSDIATSIIAYFGFKIGQKPADEEHPFGHGRAESIAGLIIVIFLALISYEILIGAIKRILSPETITTPSYLAAIMAIVGIIINIIISQYIISLGKKINSPAIISDGKHQRVDLFSSFAILIGVLISKIGYPILDPIVGLFIGIMILKVAFDVGRDNINNIMGKLPSKELIEKIQEVAISNEKVYGAHNIKIDYLGSYAHVSMHIELDSSLTLKESHKITHKVQNDILNKINIIESVTAHSCPLGEEYDHKQEIDM